MLKYCVYYCSILLPPGGSGWIIGIGWLGSSSTASGCSDSERTVGPKSNLGHRDFFFFASCNSASSILTPLFLPSPVFSSYFILAVPMHECLGKHSCKSSTFHIACCMAEG